MKTHTKNQHSIVHKLSIVIVLIVAVFVPLQQSRAGIWDMFKRDTIPTHPLLKKVNARVIVFNGTSMNVTLYTIPAHATHTIANYYTKVLLERNWKKGNELYEGEFIALSFGASDGGQFNITMRTLSGTGKAQVQILDTKESIMHWYRMAQENDLDMPGKDIVWLDRYPNAVRTQSVFDDAGYSIVTYDIFGESCINCVKDFYQKHMANAGWFFINDTYRTQEELDAMKERRHERTLRVQQEEHGDVAGVPNGETPFVTATHDTAMAQEMYYLNFRNKQKNQMCVISIVRTDPHESELLQSVYKVMEESKQRLPEMIHREYPKANVGEVQMHMEKAIDAQLASNRLLTYARFRSKQSTVSVTITAIDQSARKKLNPAVSFRIKGKE